MPKKGGKKKNKGGAKPAAAAVDKVADVTTTVGKPEAEDKAELTEQTPAPAAESKAEETPVAPAVTETQETEKKTEAENIAPAAVEKKEDVQDAVDKAQASKAGTIGTLDGGEEEGKAVLPESTNKEPALGADLYPSTTETAAEESITSTAATTGVAAAPSSLPERPKTSETTAALPSESEVAHIKRPYEKPIFSNDEVKPHKIPKTEEEQAAASATADTKVLAGAGPAATAAYTAPEPVPVATEAPKKVEEKPIAEPAAPKPTADGTSRASPEAVAAAAAAINTSKTDKSAALAGENQLKKPEAVLKRGEEPKPEIPKKDVPAKEPAPEEPAPAKEETKPSEPTTEQPEKKKGGFFGWLKRKFK